MTPGAASRAAGELACDVAVAGGGPAGAAVAYRLATLGYHVVLVAAGRRPGADRSETLPPSIALLEGVLPLARALALAEPAPHAQLAWATEGRSEYQERPGTLLVRRTPFDEALVAAAREAGVTVLADARAGPPERIPGGWRVHIRTASGARAVRARFFVDATGRNGGLHPRGRRLGPATVAIRARWRGAAEALGGTVLVEALPDAWCWGAAGSDGSLDTAVFVEMAACAGKGAAALRDRFEQLLRGGRLLGAALQGTQRGALQLCDATPTLAAICAQHDSLRVGDAAFASDPLSSQGVQCALRSGVQAAAVAHTILAGGDADAAIEFHEAANRRLAANHGRVATQLYAGYLTWRDQPFWAARAAPAPPPELGLAQGEALTADQLVRLSPRAVVGMQPALAGAWIQRVPAVAAGPDQPALAWAGTLPLVRLLRDLSGPRRAVDVVSAWSQAMPREQAQRLLQLLCEERILVAA